mmetsp:Transcript_40252/g.89383  ORF Transcript_40252/g.89383 Transcript_40252/m.89383 type:complete len:218 (+) Transcript_40252:29-682(+)
MLANKCSTSAFRRSATGPSRARIQLQIAAASKGFGAPKTVPSKGTPKQPSEPCSCSSGKAYKNCCEPAHLGSSAPKTPEAALRARFSAFVKGNEQYIVSTTHHDYLAFHYENKSVEEARKQLEQDVKVGCSMFDYTGLSVNQTEPGSIEDEGFVAFQYKSSPKDQASASEEERDWKTTNEKARFLRVNGAWQFVDYQRFEYNATSLFKDSPEPVPKQ